MASSVKSDNIKDIGKTVLQGGVIGVANIIPGVSGGTLALMLGIYQKTIDAVCSVNAELFMRVLALLQRRKGAWHTLWAYICDRGLLFLGWLGAGAMVAIVLFARLMGWLLENHQSPSYAFFGGLVLASIIFPWRRITRRSWREACACVLACVLTVGLSASVSDAERIEKVQRKQAIAAAAEEDGSQGVVVEPVRMLVIFGAAVLAISAMVLPGISGSFILLLMGVYFDILAAINQRDVLVLGVFALGALAGLLVFSRVIGWFLDRFFNVTMAFMIGLMLGSLYELWPFKPVVQVGDEMVVLGNTLQGISAGQWGVAFVSALCGLGIVLGFAQLKLKTG